MGCTKFLLNSRSLLVHAHSESCSLTRHWLLIWPSFWVELGYKTCSTERALNWLCSNCIYYSSLGKSESTWLTRALGSGKATAVNYIHAPFADLSGLLSWPWQHIMVPQGYEPQARQSLGTEAQSPAGWQTSCRDRNTFKEQKPFWNRMNNLLCWPWAVRYGPELTAPATWKKTQLISGTTKTVLGNSAFTDIWPKLKAQKYSILPQSGTVSKWGSCIGIFVLLLYPIAEPW